MARVIRTLLVAVATFLHAWVEAEAEAEVARATHDEMMRRPDFRIVYMPLFLVYKSEPLSIMLLGNGKDAPLWRTLLPNVSTSSLRQFLWC